jgi:anti-sigma-K factor RskA
MLLDDRVIESPEAATPPEALQVTLEPARGSPTPSGPLVVS